MAPRDPRVRPRPAKDEWGVYDPEQAGLAALYARLDAKDAGEKAGKKDASKTKAPILLPPSSLRDPQ